VLVQGQRGRSGTVVLYARELVFVPSRVAQFGAAFGLLGFFLSRAIAMSRAHPRAITAHPFLTRVPLVTVTEVRSEKGRFGQRIVVRTDGGEEYTLGGVRFDRWADDLAGLLVANGRAIRFTGTGLVAVAMTAGEW